MYLLGKRPCVFFDFQLPRYVNLTRVARSTGRVRDSIPRRPRGGIWGGPKFEANVRRLNPSATEPEAHEYTRFLFSADTESVQFPLQTGGDTAGQC